MVNKKFILNSDEFGKSKAFNRAVLEGYHNGFLTGASLCANGKAFNAAVNEIIPECPNLSVGIHLNITNGRSLTKVPLLTNKRGKFNKNFFTILLNSNNKKFLEQVECEFRTQIETVMNYAKVFHIDSQSHIHAIPNIFKITAKLAKEYNIPFVRTQYEEMYFVPSAKKYLNGNYYINFVKMLILNRFSDKNSATLKEYNLKTNDYIIGVGYKGLMDETAIEYGLKAIEGDGIVEISIHPGSSALLSRSKNYADFLITQNKALKDKINRLGYEITNYKNECTTK